jgi:hypothetical protein
MVSVAAPQLLNIAIVLGALNKDFHFCCILTCNFKVPIFMSKLCLVAELIKNGNFLYLQLGILDS